MRATLSHLHKYIALAEILGGTGGLEPLHFSNWRGMPPLPTLQRRQLYTWVGDSQYSVKKLHCVNSLAAAISIYTS